MTLITIGGGIGGAIIVPMLGKLITAYGWRTAAVITGVTVMVLGLPMAYFMRNTPEEMGLEPDGEKAFFDESGKRVFVPRSEANFTVRQALATGTYWNFAIAMLLRAGILSSMVIHQIPHLVDLGIGYQVATKILGSMILISIPGRFVFGWLGDKIDKRKLLFIVCLLQAAGIFIFIHASSILMLYLFVSVFGLAYGGAIPLVQGLTADLFGRKIFATLSGITVSLTMISTVSAPVLLGRLYDVTKSYSIGFYVLFIFISLSGLCFYLIRLPKQASAVRQ
jgi:sugar phosphate permease